MRKSRKSIVIAGTVAGVLVGGAAFAYWSSTGTGTGTGSTTAGASNLAITGNVASQLYPGQGPQSFSAQVVNNADNAAYVAGLTAYVTTDKQGCDGSDFSINGSGSAANPVALTWTAGDLASGANRSSSNTIQFVNKSTNQDACKGAALTLHYASS